MSVPDCLTVPADCTPVPTSNLVGKYVLINIQGQNASLSLLPVLSQDKESYTFKLAAVPWPTVSNSNMNSPSPVTWFYSSNYQLVMTVDIESNLLSPITGMSPLVLCTKAKTGSSAGTYVDPFVMQLNETDQPEIISRWVLTQTSTNSYRIQPVSLRCKLNLGPYVYCLLDPTLSLTIVSGMATLQKTTSYAFPIVAQNPPVGASKSPNPFTANTISVANIISNRRALNVHLAQKYLLKWVADNPTPAALIASQRAMRTKTNKVTKREGKRAGAQKSLLVLES